MRRARITVTANIPIRRKFQLENAKITEKSEPNDDIKKEDEVVNDNIDEKSITENSSKDKYDNKQIENKEVNENVNTESMQEKSSEGSQPKAENTVVKSIEESPISETKNPLLIENIEIKAPIISTEVSSSPSKSVTNRVCFMRPVPRLDGHGRIRRNSVQGSGASASESEDDTRRNTSQVDYSKSSDNPAQNSSEKEINSNNINNNNNNVNNSNNNVSNNVVAGGNSKINMKQKRKVVVSESARKLAEARREFHMKHEHKQPDRTKLTMYDLIYYNPVTNPMKKNSDDSTSNTPAAPVTNADEPSEEDEDNPPETAMPVPQVKVGPDGQLIIDEQSLVIERTGVKKSREAMAKRQAVVDDGNNYGGGFYKRRKRVKEWPKWETIKFFKALSSIGTDFLLMQTLFPERTRQEIKSKFKKEEKLNRKLVEKALSCKLDFDVDLLKQDFETYEKIEESEPKNPLPSNITVRRRKKARRVAATSIGEANENSQDEEPKKDNEKPVRRERKPRKMINRQNSDKSSKRSASPTTSAESNYEDNDEAESDSDTEVYRPRPTKSGRVPKPTKYLIKNKNLDNILGNKRSEDETADKDSDETIESNSHEVKSISTDTVMTLENIATAVPDLSTAEPGSLVILSNVSANEPGKTLVQVYMVKSNIGETGKELSKTLTPVDIEPEILSTVTNGLIAAASNVNESQTDVYLKRI